MSLYDEVIINCPSCGNEQAIQTKVGRCQLIRYNLKSVPPYMLTALSGRSLLCDKCGANISITIRKVITYSPEVVLTKDLKSEEEEK